MRATPSWYSLPGWLYESLPAIYSGAGFGALLLLEHDLGQLSGAVLLVVALRVYLLRRRARRQPLRARGDGEAVLMSMAWLRVYRLGHPEIDAQHEHLFALSHALLDDLLAARHRAVRERLPELAAEIEAHFRSEEEAMRESDRHARAHARRHRELLGRMHALISGYNRGKVARHVVIHFMLHEVVRQHLTLEDTGFLAAREAA